eukprot:532380-Pyramimonas_sp.AAC.1
MTGLDPTDGIGRTRSIPQGDPEAPREFTYDLDVAVEIFVGACRKTNGVILWRRRILRVLGGRV